MKTRQDGLREAAEICRELMAACAYTSLHSAIEAILARASAASAAEQSQLERELAARSGELVSVPREQVELAIQCLDLLIAAVHSSWAREGDK